jgi:hypothetical protein
MYDSDCRGLRRTCKDCLSLNKIPKGIPDSNPEALAQLLEVVTDMYERDSRLTQENRELLKVIENYKKREHHWYRKLKNENQRLRKMLEGHQRENTNG